MDLLLVFLCGFIGLCWVLYARAIKIKNKVYEAESAIEVQFQKRHDLVPNVLKLAKRFMEHEASLLGELTAIRSNVNQKGQGVTSETIELDQTVSGALNGFFALAENYPDLKSNSAITEAQNTFKEVEGHISAARRFYNSAVYSNNNLCETFPLSVFAKIVGAKRQVFFHADEGTSKPVNVDDYL